MMLLVPAAQAKLASSDKIVRQASPNSASAAPSKGALKSAHATVQSLTVNIRKVSGAKSYEVTVAKAKNGKGKVTKQIRRLSTTFFELTPKKRYIVKVKAYASSHPSENAKPIEVSSAKVKTQGYNALENHVHKSLKIPLASHLKAIVKGDRANVYYRSCTCGKEYKETFKQGINFTKKIKRVSKRFKKNAKGGIALIGSSMIRHWYNADIDINTATGYPSKKVYNMAVSASGPPLLTDMRYLKAVAKHKPKVIVIDGINYMLHYREAKGDCNEEAAQVMYAADMEAIAKLHRLLPQAKIIMTSAIRIPIEYKRAMKAGKDCFYWTRVLAYNKLLKACAQRLGYVNYVDIEKDYLYEGGDGVVYYYTDYTGVRSPSYAVSVTTLLKEARKGYYLSPFFSEDLHHPSEWGYSLLWAQEIGTKATELLGFAKSNDSAVGDGTEVDDASDVGDPEAS